MSIGAIQLEPVERLIFEAGLFSCGCKGLDEVDLPAELADEDFRQQLYDRAQYARVTSMLAFLFSEMGSRCPLPAVWQERYRSLSEMVRCCNQQRMTLTREVVTVLRAADIPVLVLKGWDLMLTCYSPKLLRWSDDVDLLVPRERIGQARDLLLACGMVFGCMDKATGQLRPPLEEELSRSLDSHQELAPFVVRLELPDLNEYASLVPDLQQGGFHQIAVADTVAFGFVVDLHYALVHNYPQSEPFEGVVEFEQEGFTWPFLSREQMFSYLSAKYYHEIMRGDGRLRQFFDLLALVRRYGATMDWDSVWQVIERHVYHPSVYYMASHLNRLLGPVIPEELVGRCNPANPRLKANHKLCRYHHWGDFMPKLLRHGVVVPVTW